MVVLDSETTGLGSSDQVIEIAVVDLQGNVLIDERIRPSVPIEPSAEEVHGISLASLQNALQWPDIAGRLKEVLVGKRVVIYNRKFDCGVLCQTAEAFSDQAAWIQDLEIVCAMAMAAETFGPTNRYGTISLTNAVAAAGLQFQGDAHSAVGDALTTAALYQNMIKRLGRRAKYRERVAARKGPVLTTFKLNKAEQEAANTLLLFAGNLANGTPSELSARDLRVMKKHFGVSVDFIFHKEVVQFRRGKEAQFKRIPDYNSNAPWMEPARVYLPFQVREVKADQEK